MRFFWLSLFTAFGFLLLVAVSLPDKNLHVVFCDVGQGDAILANYGSFQMLVDGGPDRSVLSCLGKYVPFWDRKLEIVAVTHPQEDHYGGIIDVVRNYEIGMFVHPDVAGESQGWNVLEGEIKQRKIPEQFVQRGDVLRYQGLRFEILSPIPGYISKELNDYSIVGDLKYKLFNVLLTGDIENPVEDDDAQIIRPVEVLKVPHHGSKNGLTPVLLDAASPKLAVISVGKKNRYGHPHEETLRLLSDKGVKLLRTDQNGTIEITSDGEKWWVKKEL